ncbi:hypothetical protein, partial [Bosea sp. (in: a-proteobacteria)]|uniref:hypothetical protein n=1 Tax=Bosea sp. (in: a-proteobacteria) TaxID=1871050 RepID=UPI004034BAF8
QNNEADLMQKLVDREYHQKGAELMSYCLQFSLMAMRLHRLPQDLLCMYFIAGLKPELKRECATMPDGNAPDGMRCLLLHVGVMWLRELPRCLCVRSPLSLLHPCLTTRNLMVGAASVEGAMGAHEAVLLMAGVPCRIV